MIVEYYRPHRLLLASSRLLKKQIASPQNPSNAFASGNSTNGWFSDIDSKAHPVKVCHSDAGYVIDSVWFCPPRPITTPADGPFEAMNRPMSRPIAKPIDP